MHRGGMRDEGWRGGMRDVTSAIISHELTQSNQVCCFQTLDAILQRISFQIIFLNAITAGLPVVCLDFCN